MSKHQDFDKETAAKKMYQKPKTADEIKNEFATLRAQLGELEYLSKKQAANMQRITLRMAELEDEYGKVKKTEEETLHPTPMPEPVTTEEIQP